MKDQHWPWKKALESLQVERVANGYILEAKYLGPDTSPHSGGNAFETHTIREIICNPFDLIGRIAELAHLEPGNSAASCPVYGSIDDLEEARRSRKERARTRGGADVS